MRTLLAMTLLAAAAAPACGQAKGHLYAHRGGGHEFEENTLAAFRGSYAKGIRGFETDVRMTKDGHYVILHDDTLDRTHTAAGSVEDKTLAELKGVATKKGGEPLLSLDDFLAFCADKPGLYLELEMKTRNKKQYPDDRLPAYCAGFRDLVRAKQPKGATVVFSSFDERPLKIMRDLDAKAELMLITGDACTPELVQKAVKLGMNRVACKMEGTSRAAVKEAQKAGLKVNGWPGHTLQDYHLAVGLGVDGICTDVPGAVLAYQKGADR